MLEDECSRGSAEDACSPIRPESGLIGWETLARKGGAVGGVEVEYVDRAAAVM